MTRSEVLDFLKENNLDVFPLKGKIPTCKWTEPFNGEIQLNENFGIKMGGKYKIVVIDVDDYSLVEYFKKFFHVTYVVKTGKGFHIYIKVNTLPPIGRLDNSKGQHIDIQSTGTYVVGETSIHPETKKEYQMISDKREINEVDFEEIKEILERLGFNTTKKPIKEELSDAIKNGIPEGNRTNILFNLSCHLLRVVKDSQVVYNTIESINEKSKPSLEKYELDQLFKSAISYVKNKIIQENQKFNIDRKEIEILDKTPQELRAITLDANKTRLILVYLSSKEIENKIVEHKSKAFIVTNGVEGKRIILLEDEYIKKNFITNLFSEFSLLSNRWKYEDILKYISSDDKVNPKEIFENLVKFEKKYFENEYDYDYYYESCWIIHTYFYTLFEKTPYNDYFGMKNVGKSKQLNSLRMLCYNGILSGDSSVSSVFRIIEGTGATLLLDETENLGGGKENRADMENLLRNGFDREGKVIRSKFEKNKSFTPESFSVYSPKAFGHINGLDNVLEDRIIRTKLTRTTNKKIADSEPDEYDDKTIYEIRESLYRLFLDYGHEIKELIPNAKSQISEVSGRELKLWLSIVTIALFYEKQGVEGLVDKIKEKMLTNSEERKISNLEDNLDFRILSILDLATELPQQSRNLYDLITLKLDELYKEEKRGDKILKQSLDRLGFRSKRISQGVMWSITREKIQEAKEKIGLVKPTQTTLSKVDSTQNVGNVGSVVS